VAQERLKIIILVLDNQQLGMVRQWQDRVYDGRHEAVHFGRRPGHPDFGRLAQAYGVTAADVSSPAALDAALDAAVASGAPALIRIAVDPAVDNAPMMPAGTDFSYFHGNCVARPGELFSGAEDRLLTEAADG
jgi:acetolactate synthase-1/2/3 large subunit